MSREDDFITSYMEYAGSTEVPPVFAFWCSVSAISAALGRRSWVQFGPWQTYPNFYILLVAPSALNRKSTAIRMAGKMVRDLQPPPKIIPENLTPPALMDELKKVEVNDITCLLRASGTGYVLADEFKSFLNRKSYDMGLATLLIQLFDCNDTVEYKTISRGLERVEKSCLSVLGGSTSDWLRDGIPPDAIGGGLTSRMIFIQPREKSQLVSWPVHGPRQMFLYQSAVKRLQSISQVEGEFIITPEAKTYCQQTYMDFWNSGVGPIMEADPMLTGYTGRRQQHQLKLSMILSASTTNEKIITLDHIQRATMALEEAEKYLPKIMSQISATPIGANIDVVRRILSQGKNGMMSRSELQRKLSHKFDKKILDDILGTLIDANLVTQMLDGASVIYKTIGE